MDTPAEPRAARRASGPPADSDDLVYRVDADDVITAIEGPWDDVAARDGANDLSVERVIGRPLWDFVADATTRHLYRALFQQARSGHPVSVPLRCDSPACRRWLRISVSPLPGASRCIEVRSREERVESRDPVDGVAWGPQPPPGEERPVVAMCGWCNRVRVDDEWLEVEVALQAMRILERDEVPALTHGICPTCVEAVDAEIERATVEGEAEAS